ncbi:MAG: type I phosphomannose isomerase catalytic subunit [Saccharofermentanales bacterium]
MRNNNLQLKYPVKMKPVFKDYIWGGDKLIREWGKKCPYEIAAESWELSAHMNGQSTAVNGPLEGMTLSEVVEAFGGRSLGEHCSGADRFPVLIKLIDPRQKLSIQVHPDDEYAIAHEGDYGKTEMWYIAEAGTNGSILCGFSKDIDAEQYREAISNNTLPDIMNRIPVSKGDVFFIKPGTVHAICEDLIIAEIQQNSDVTYRVYDYDRKGPDGKGRPLHIAKALEVSDLRASAFDGGSAGEPVDTPFGTSRILVSCRYFTVTEYRSLTGKAELISGADSFSGILFLEGSGSIRYKGGEAAFTKGDTFFIPADMGPYEISGMALFLVTEV